MFGFDFHCFYIVAIYMFLQFLAERWVVFNSLQVEYAVAVVSRRYLRKSENSTVKIETHTFSILSWLVLQENRNLLA